jgi:hypothetical protein
MKPFNMQIRNDAYREILQWGLLAIRNWAANKEHVKLVEIEADHIHNLPSLIDEGNEARHVCYIEQERELYLERLEKETCIEYKQFILARYTQPWEILKRIAEHERNEWVPV